MTSEDALQNLRDALRAELVAELVEKLEAWRDGLENVDQSYLDGADDTIITIQEG